MKKLYFLFFTILLIAFVYWGISTLKKVIPQFLYVSEHIITTNATSSSGSTLFKSTPENEELIDVMLNIHKEFTNNPPSPYKEKPNSIIDFYKIQKLFPNFSSYHIAKLKITNTIFNELDEFYKNTNSLTTNELNDYFNKNTEYLEQIWGINDFNELANLVNILKNKNGKKVSSCSLDESYFYIKSTNTTNFMLKLTLEDDSIFYLGVTTCFDETSKYQSTPVIRFYAPLGGTEL